jgi:hypothetical protein
MKNVIATGLLVGTTALFLSAAPLLADEALTEQGSKAVAQSQDKAGDLKTPAITRVQKRQAARIKQGVKNGELTAEEAKELREGQKEVREMKQEARADGKVDMKERKEIRKEQKKQSKEIYRKKHNETKRK